jgi:chromosomal replication initiator protein
MPTRDFWSSCLSRFEAELPAQQFNAWIKTLRLETDADPSQLRLVAPNRYVMDWVRRRYFDTIESLAREYFPAPVAIALAVDAAAEPEPVVESLAAAGPAAVEPMAVPRSSGNPIYERTRLNPDATFDTLVTGRSNDMARAASQQVAINPGTSYNPLFIYGGTGLGKTHMIQAIGNAVWQSNPSAKVCYIHATDYVSDFVRTLQQKSFDSFKQYYNSLDLLLIDDIQFFNGKDRTQEEFFYAFNALVGAKKQIVITCDTYPKDIQGVEERLISRFGSGLVVQIEPPELEMRVAILRKKAESQGLDLGDDVAFLIAKNLRSNVRELEGALKKVMAYASFQNRQIDMEIAREALKDVIGAHNRQITLDLIQKTVADYYKIKVADMFSQKRTRVLVRPRQIAMWLSRELTGHSLPEIGDAFGGRDHTTVIHACKQVAELRSRDTQLNNDLHVLQQTIKG